VRPSTAPPGAGSAPLHSRAAHLGAEHGAQLRGRHVHKRRVARHARRMRIVRHRRQRLARPGRHARRVRRIACIGGHHERRRARPRERRQLLGAQARRAAGQNQAARACVRQVARVLQAQALRAARGGARQTGQAAWCSLQVHPAGARGRALVPPATMAATGPASVAGARGVGGAATASRSPNARPPRRATQNSLPAASAASCAADGAGLPGCRSREGPYAARRSMKTVRARPARRPCHAHAGLGSMPSLFPR